MVNQKEQQATGLGIDNNLVTPFKLTAIFHVGHFKAVIFLKVVVCIQPVRAFTTGNDDPKRCNRVFIPSVAASRCVISRPRAQDCPVRPKLEQCSARSVYDCGPDRTDCCERVQSALEADGINPVH
jgi:hypothetical protein